MIEGAVIKMALAIVILTLLVGTWQWDRKAAYDGGYNAGKAEQLDAYKKAESEAAGKLSEAVAERDKWEKIAIELQKKKPKVVTVYVDRIIEKNPDCAVLHGFSELWNQYTD